MLDNIFLKVFFIIIFFIVGILLIKILFVPAVKQIWKWKYNAKLYIGLLVTTLCMFLLQILTNQYWGILLTILCYVIYFLVLGAINYYDNEKGLIDDVKEKRIFDIINIKNLDGSYPNIYKKLTTKDGRVIYLIHTNVPIFEWENNKLNIEKAFNTKILSFGHGYTKNLIRISTAKEITELIKIHIHFEDIFGSDKDIQIHEKPEKNNVYTVYSANISSSAYEEKKFQIEEKLSMKIISINKLNEKNVEIEFKK